MFELNDVLAARFFFGEVMPRAVVEDVAVLQNLDERGALVRRGSCNVSFRCCLENVHGACDERGFRANGQRHAD